MSKITAFVSVTLDGVMQAPGRPDEDLRGEFPHGGWAVPYADEAMGQAAAEGTGHTGAMLLGRRTYQDLHGYWPARADNPFTEVLNNTRKYVASRTLTEPLPWQNSVLLPGDAADADAELRQRPGRDVVVLGSGELQSLMRRDLVDEYQLLIHPLVLGTGRKLFPDGSPYAALRLADSTTTTTGVVIARYQPAGRTP
jgi:dihydrofolate reductase